MRWRAGGPPSALCATVQRTPSRLPHTFTCWPACRALAGRLLQPAASFCSAAAAAAPSGAVAQATKPMCTVLLPLYRSVARGEAQLSDGDVMRLLSTASMPLHTLPRLLHVGAEELRGAMQGRPPATSLAHMVPSMVFRLGRASKELAVLLSKLALATPPSRALAAALASRPLRQPALLSWLSTTIAVASSLSALCGEWAAIGRPSPTLIAQNCCAPWQDV